LKIFAERSLHTAEVAGYIGAIMSYWACAQLEANRERLALHCLGLAGYQTYLPRIRVRRITQGRKVSVRTSPLFPGYAFVLIELQWHAARWSPGVLRLVLDSDRPARVPDRVIADLRGRECNGFVVLPPPPEFRCGDRVLVKHGPFTDHLALYEGQAPHARVEVLLTLFGARRRIELPKGDIAAV
jgi:transcriptional antiterminator RfaH